MVESERRKSGNRNSEIYLMSGALSTPPDPEGSLPGYIDTDEGAISSNETCSMASGEKA